MLPRNDKPLTAKRSIVPCQSSLSRYVVSMRATRWPFAPPTEISVTVAPSSASFVTVSATSLTPKADAARCAMNSANGRRCIQATVPATTRSNGNAMPARIQNLGRVVGGCVVASSSITLTIRIPRSGGEPFGFDAQAFGEI